MRYAAFKSSANESVAEYRVRWQAGLPAPQFSVPRCWRIAEGAMTQKVPQKLRRIRVGLALHETPQPPQRERRGVGGVGEQGVEAAVVLREVEPARFEPVGRAALAVFS